MQSRLTKFAIIRACAAAAASSALLSGCETPQQQRPQDGGILPQTSGPTLGEVKTTTRVGPAKMSLEQVQAEVEAFADRYVISVAQGTDRVARENPEFRQALHAVKLSVGSGAYTIASGPNPVVSMLDLLVQATLVRNSIEKNLAQRLPEEAGQQLLSVFARLEQEAWALGARVLSDQELADLRVLIDTWIQENPDQVYVAGIRFADFSRLRPREGTSLPSSIFGLLHIDPFASIDPAAREIGEARELADRMFYYLQRMPQLVKWQSEGLYYELAGASETQQVLSNMERFTEATTTMSGAILELPAEIRAQLEQSETTVQNLVEQIDSSLSEARATVAEIEEASETLQQAGEAAADAGRSWEQTVLAFNDVVTALSPPDDPAAPPREPVSVRDYITALKEAQATAEQLRALLNDINTTAQGGTIESSVAASVAETRRGAQGVVITATVCGAVLVSIIVVGGIIYRVVSHKLIARTASSAVVRSHNE